MSERQFENFLAQELVEWGSKNILKGYRYQFQSPDSDKSKKLFNALIELSNSKVSIQNVDIPWVALRDTKLLVVLHDEEGEEGFSENFISHIRDVVAAQQADIKNSSLIVIHNSMLDTLINSAENIAQPGWIWHPNEIMDALKRLIDPHLSNVKISKCLLKHKFDQIVEDGSTMFGFEELYKALVNDGDLWFDELGLLNDPALKSLDWPERQINHRLEKNKQLYEKIDYITHNFPTNLEEKLGEINFGPGFVKKHFKDGDTESWKSSLEFSACEQEQQRNKDNLLELEKEILSVGELYSRTKAETKAGKREKHLICLLGAEQSSFEITFVFLGGKVEAKQCSVMESNVHELIVSSPDNTGGKRSRVSLSGKYSEKAAFIHFRVKRNKTTETHHFKIAILRKGEFYEDAFKYSYLVEPKKQRMTLQLEDYNLQISDIPKEVKLESSPAVIDNREVGIIDFGELAIESEFLEFTVKGHTTELTFNIEGAVASDVLFLPLILDQGKHSKLYQDNYFAVLNKSKTKVQLENQEVAPKGRRLSLLQRERELLEDSCLYLSDTPSNSYFIKDVQETYPSLGNAYYDLFEYLIESGTLPSLSGWGQTFRDKASIVVNEYYRALEELQYDMLLTKDQKKLVNLGFANYDGEEYLTPYHPLVLAYYLNLTGEFIKDSTNSFKTLPRVTVGRLSPQGLLPFVYNSTSGFSYTYAEADNSMWLKLVPQQETSYDFVKKLVRDKVTEFHSAFSCLFDNGYRSKIIINSVNNGSNKELFFGLVDFIKQKKDEVCQIHVNLYDDELAMTEFDSFADTHSYDELKARYGLNSGAIKDIADSIIELIRTRLTYSKFKNQKLPNGGFKSQAYAHITFFRNNNRVQPTDVNVNQELSGIVSNGLLAGEAATSKEDSYFTAFGLKGIDVENHTHLQIAQKLNGLIKPARKSNEQYSRSKSMALAVSDKFKNLLSCSYKSSIWTTIIDPKVTLDFFDNEKNVVLIHYSDNYTNSVNYDAITVTEESELYKKVLEQDQGGIIEEFNAFNGEWLLKLITANANDRKEKKGILGAYKFVNCLLQKSDITWVPVSVAEMIRVAGNIGLRMSDSDFSRNVQGYKSGLISDDVLFVGFKDSSMILLPLEVKTGKKQTHKKGVDQAKELKRYLTENILGADSLAGNLYRGLFIRQILMQIDKYKLYHLYDEGYFDDFLSQREWWMQGNYEIKDILNYPDGFLVSHVENDTFFEPTFTEDRDILKIQLPISYLNTFIKTPLKELFAHTQPEKLCHIDSKYLLNQETEIGTITDEDAAVNLDAEDKAEVKELTDAPNKPEETSVESTESFESNSCADKVLKVLVGHSTLENEPVYWEPTNTAKFMNTNSGIIGTMGTGKTQSTKSVVTQLHRNKHLNVDGKEIGILIFDYKSDYVDDKFLSATNGKKYNLFKLPYNPLSLFGDTPMLPVHTARGFSETMGKAFGLGQKQQLKLRKLIGEAYELAGIHKADQSTWSQPAPTIADVWALFEESEPTEDSLYAALESLNELIIFETDIQKCTSLYELVDGITVIELAGYPSEIQNLVVALTLDLFYSQMQKQGKPEVRRDFRQVTKLILVDEADNFMSQNFPSLRKVLKEGREYGVGTILSTQDITHFKTGENDYSAYILSWIVHRVSQIKSPDIKSIFNKDDKASQEYLMKSIRELEKHHSLYVDGDKKITKIKDKAFWELLD
ncbi:DNA phosphorothioation-dependent restriction protein DptH [Aliikangiella sp. IMCC44632]